MAQYRSGMMVCLPELMEVWPSMGIAGPAAAGAQVHGHDPAGKLPDNDIEHAESGEDEQVSALQDSTRHVHIVWRCIPLRQGQQVLQ